MVIETALDGIKNKSIILTAPFQLENVPFWMQWLLCMFTYNYDYYIILHLGIREKVNTEELFYLL